MKPTLGWIAVGACLLLSATAQAKPEFLEVFLTKYKIADSSKLADKSCAICHVSDEDQNFNPYGKDLAKALKASGSEKITPAILASIEKLDSSHNNATNLQQIQAGVSPGEPHPGMFAAKAPPKPAKVEAKPTKGEPKQGKSDVVAPQSTESTEPTGLPEEHPTPPDPVPVKVKTPLDYIPKHALHPAFIHFPIALFLAGLALDFIGLLKGRKELLLAGWYNLVLGAIGALVAVGSGFAGYFMQHLHFKGIIQQHLILAVASTVCMWIMVFLRVHRHEKMNVALRGIYYVLAALGLLMISYASHLGGVWVHGS